MIEIRIVTPEEWEFFRDVRLGALSDSPEAFSSTFEREELFTKDEWISRITNGASILATENGVGIGIIGAIQTSESKSDEYNVVAMWVHPNHRGTNVAVKLLEAVKNWAKQKQAKSIYLHVKPTNPRAKSFYTKVGFREVPYTRFNPVCSDVDYIEMVYKL